MGMLEEQRAGWWVENEAGEESFQWSQQQSPVTQTGVMGVEIKLNLLERDFGSEIDWDKSCGSRRNIGALGFLTGTRWTETGSTR